MNNTKKTILGVIGGVTIGAVLGLLLTPKSGKETREDIAKSIEDLKNKIASLIEQGEDLASENITTLMQKVTELENELLKSK